MIKALIIFLFAFILLSTSAAAIYNDDSCELQAKDYQKVHGGDLILVQPLKNNGAYDLGKFSGHWMNKAYNKEYGSYYYDSQDKTVYFSKHTIELSFKEMWNKDVVVLNYNQGEIPFGINWHY